MEDNKAYISYGNGKSWTFDDGSFYVEVELGKENVIKILIGRSIKAISVNGVVMKSI